MNRTTASGYLPYLLTILGLLTTLHTTRSPPDTFAASPKFQELVLSLSTVLDIMESKLHVGKETSKDVRFRHLIGIRTWRMLRNVRKS